MPATASSSFPKHLVLYDGECGLCQYSVRTILQADDDGLFYFTALQSEVGQRVLREHDKPQDDFKTLYYLENGEALHQKSTAALQIAKKLPPYRGAASLLSLLPRGLLDICYDLVSRFRKRLFPLNNCSVITEDEKGRFLDLS